MRVLVACEFSGIVRDAFGASGHDAWSCDLLETERAGQHIQGDVKEHLSGRWDLMVAHPPCTFLANSGVRWLEEVGEARMEEMRKAAAFFNELLNAPIDRVAVENPIPHRYARELIGDYTQLIQPWQFGHGEKKATCLWLRNLPPLQPTHLEGDLFCEPAPVERVPRCHREPPGAERWKNRSRTFPGIAKAMAEQWGER